MIDECSQHAKHCPTTEPAGNAFAVSAQIPTIIKGKPHEQLQQMRFSCKIRQSPPIVPGTAVEMAHPVVSRLEIIPEITNPGRTGKAAGAIPIEG